MKKLLIKSNGQVIDVRYGNDEALKNIAKQLRETYRKMKLNYKISVVKM